MCLNIESNCIQDGVFSSDQFQRVKAIQNLQKNKGGVPCFKTGYRYFCDATYCVWRHDCQNDPDGIVLQPLEGGYGK